MLMAAVVLPDAFDKTCFAAPGYRDHAELFFKGIESNGVILVDSDSRLLSELDSKIAGLSLKDGQQLQIRLAEMSKAKRCQKIVPVDKSVCRTSTTAPLVKVAKKVFATCGAHTLVTDPGSHLSLLSDGMKSDQLTPLGAYTGSVFEDQRRRAFENLPPIDKLTAGEVDRLLVEATRYSRWLRLYDKQVGKGRNLSHFLRGVERLIDLWVNAAHFPTNGLSVEFYTCVDESPDADPNAEVAYNRYIGDVIQPLRKRFSIPVRAFFKEDDQNICHDRYFQVQAAAFSVSRGFDFVNPNGSYRRCVIRVEPGCIDHLQEYRKLPDFKPPA